MKIKSILKIKHEWKLEIHTSNAQYTGKGKYFTSCFFKDYQGQTFSLVTKYSQSEKEAGETHLDIASRAMNLFSISLNN